MDSTTATPASTRKHSAAAPTPSRRGLGEAADAALELPAPPPHELIEGPSREDLIRRRAYDLYERNGCVEGRAMEDWLEAEAELDRTVIEGTSPLEKAVEQE